MELWFLRQAMMGAGNWPLISEDGHYVALVRTIPVSRPDQVVLSVYRTWPVMSVVAIYKAAELLTEKELTPDHRAGEPVVDGGHSWMEGGELAFSDDSQELIYCSRSNRTVHLRLADGQVVKNLP